MPYNACGGPRLDRPGLLYFMPGGAILITEKTVSLAGGKDVTGMLDRVQLKQEAKAILRGAAVSPWLFALLYLLITKGMDYLDTFTSGTMAEYLRVYYPQLPVPDLLARSADIPPAVSTFISVAVMLLGVVLHAGFALYHLGIRRGRPMPYSTLFSGVAVAGRVIWLAVVEASLILLWSLLFIVPGIVAAYRYRFALYNLLEDPSLRVWDAIALSKEQTYGFKTDLFLLDLSFLGWAVLSVFTFGVLSVWLTPYMEQTGVGFYQAVKRVKGMERVPEQTDPPAEFR